VNDSVKCIIITLSLLWRCIGSRLYVQSLASLVGSTSLFLPLIYLQDRQ